MKGFPISHASRRSWSGRPWKAYQPKPYFLARYNGTCQACKGQLEKGEKTVKHPDGYAHFCCPLSFDQWKAQSG
jgi:hypothetical protein